MLLQADFGKMAQLLAAGVTKDPLAGVVNHEKEFKGSDIDVAKGGHGGDGSMSIVEAMHNHRRLTARQIQLLSIAGTIGMLLLELFLKRLLLARVHVKKQNDTSNRAWKLTPRLGCTIHRCCTLCESHLEYCVKKSLIAKQVGIGTSLRDGGPLSLILGFIVWTSVSMEANLTRGMQS